MPRTYVVIAFLLACVLFPSDSFAQAPTAPDIAPFLAVSAPVVALNHVRVIDGTGAPAKEDQVVLIADGKIVATGPASTPPSLAGAQVLERSGYTVIPGLVGMHDHLYYTDSATLQPRPAEGGRS